jgi:hypothetical protein
MNIMYFLHVHFSEIVTCQRVSFGFIAWGRVVLHWFFDHVSRRDFDGFTRLGVSSLDGFWCVIVV